MSMGSMTVNSFLILRTGAHGRCSFTLTQYRMLPCFPSKEVTSVSSGSWKLKGNSCRPAGRTVDSPLSAAEKGRQTYRWVHSDGRLQSCFAFV